MAPSGDSLQQKLSRSTLDLNTRIVLWSKRGEALKAVGRSDEAIAQYKFLVDSVEARPVWIQAALRLLRSFAPKNTKEIRRLDSMLQRRGVFVERIEREFIDVDASFHLLQETTCRTHILDNEMLDAEDDFLVMGRQYFFDGGIAQGDGDEV